MGSISQMPFALPRGQWNGSSLAGAWLGELTEPDGNQVADHVKSVDERTLTDEPLILERGHDRREGGLIWVIGRIIELDGRIDAQYSNYRGEVAVSFGFDPIAFLTSLFAVWFAWHESRKNNTVLLKIVDVQCTGRQAINENHCQPFMEFRVLIRNQGIALYDPQLALGYTEQSGFGSMTVPLKRRTKRTGEISQFARGMIAEFGFKTYEMDEHDFHMLNALKDVADQKARLTLFSQGFVAKVFHAGRWRDRLAQRWNSLAFRLNSKFDRKVGEQHLKRGHFLPADVPNIAGPLRQFIRGVQKQE
jgi:hypothetical protein